MITKELREKQAEWLTRVDERTKRETNGTYEVPSAKYYLATFNAAEFASYVKNTKEFVQGCWKRREAPELYTSPVFSSFE